MKHLTEKECNLVCALIMCASDDDMERFAGNEGQITQQQLNDLLERLESGDELVPACTPERLAVEFSKILRSWLTVDEMEEVIRRNKKQTCDSVCHSHDFCDANMAMAQALENCGLPEIDGEDIAGTERWGKAWSIAKRNEFKDDALNDPIRSTDDGRRFIAYLLARDLMFHLDDDPHDIDWHSPITDETKTQIAERHAELWKVGDPWVYAQDMLDPQTEITPRQLTTKKG